MAQFEQRKGRIRYVGSAACLGVAVASAVAVALSPERLDHPVVLGSFVLAVAGFVVLTQATTRDERFHRVRRVNDLQLATVLHGQDYREQNLTNIVLRSRTLDRSSFAKGTLLAADLTRSSCVATDFASANLAGARFEHADLTEASLRGADLTDANLNHAMLVDADLRGANLSGADLRDADMSGANLCGADLRNTIVNRTLLERATYDPSTRLPYNLTSDRRASAGLEATVDSSLQPAEPVRRKLSFEPGFVAASIGSAAIALAVMLVGGIFQAEQRTPTPATQVAGRVEVASVDDGRSLVIEADADIDARLLLRSGGIATVRLGSETELDSVTLQEFESVTLVADAHTTVLCTLLLDGWPVAVERLSSDADSVGCPLELP